MSMELLNELNCMQEELNKEHYEVYFYCLFTEPFKPDAIFNQASSFIDTLG